MGQSAGDNAKREDLGHHEEHHESAISIHGRYPEWRRSGGDSLSSGVAGEWDLGGFHNPMLVVSLRPRQAGNMVVRLQPVSLEWLG